MIQRSSRHTIPAILLVLLVCMILIPCVSADAPTPTATVPPLLLACSHASQPQASFTCNFPGDPSAKIPDGPPYPVNCFDNSSSAPGQPIDSWSWEFGDGGTSTMQNPEHTYSGAGQYDIRLTVTTECGSKYSNTTVNSMSIYCSLPEPAFTTNVTEGSAPLAVQVTDGSQNTPENITTWTYWLDSTPFSNDRNPVFFFSTPGNYTISQTVWKDCIQTGSYSYPRAIYAIKVNPPGYLSSGGKGTSTILTLPTTTAVTGVPGNGTLSVITDPTGARIFLDNVLRGTSPATVPDLPAGSHTLLLEKEGYHNMTIPVLINAGKVTGFSTTLTPVSGDSQILPVIALAVIIFGVAGALIYLYRKWKKE